MPPGITRHDSLPLLERTADRSVLSGPQALIVTVSSRKPECREVAREQRVEGEGAEADDRSRKTIGAPSDGRRVANAMAYACCIQATWRLARPVRGLPHIDGCVAGARYEVQRAPLNTYSLGGDDSHEDLSAFLCRTRWSRTKPCS